MYTTKKLIAGILSVMMLLGLLTGCGTTGNAPATTEAIQGSSPVGTLLVSMDAEFLINYDAEGFAVSITGTNEAGRTAAATVTDFVGRDCVHAVRALLDAVVEGKLSGNAKLLVLRLGMESEIPSEGFLENIGQDVQYKCDELGSGLAVKLITDNELSDGGFINPETAKELAAKHAGVEATALQGSEDVEDGVYTFTFGEGDDADTATVDAGTGRVTLESESAASAENDDGDSEIVDPDGNIEQTETPDQSGSSSSGSSSSDSSSSDTPAEDVVANDTDA